MPAQLAQGGDRAALVALLQGMGLVEGSEEALCKGLGLRCVADLAELDESLLAEFELDHGKLPGIPRRRLLAKAAELRPQVCLRALVRACALLSSTAPR